MEYEYVSDQDVAANDAMMPNNENTLYFLGRV